jgi:hypothetical protein
MQKATIPAVVIIAAWFGAATWIGSPDDGRGHLDAASIEFAAGTVAAPPPSSPPVPTVPAASVTVEAQRGVQEQVGTTAPPPPLPSSTRPIGGDCEAWRQVFAARGATAAELEFFFDGGIIWRETRCGADTLNEQSGDSGICQINPIHNRPGWFGGREFGAGGWLGMLHGLSVRNNTDSVAWTDACLTLFRVCGTGPWQPPYSCANRPLGG